MGAACQIDTTANASGSSSATRLTMEATGLFATPLWSFNYPDRDQLLTWSEHILHLEGNDTSGLTLTNQGGWHSQTDLLADPDLNSVFRWIAGCTQRAVESIGWDTDRASPCFNNAWAMVNREGHSVRAHLHPNSLFSGVLYLTAPEGSGAIALLDPRAGAQVLLPPLRDPAAGYACGRVLRQPRPGLLLLFPGWLWHEVERSRSSEPRICISFNIGMRPLRSNADARRTNKAGEAGTP